MSIIHLNHIKAHITKLFEQHIKVEQKGIKQCEMHFLSKSLAAYAICTLSQCNEKCASDALVDGENDNGIDAIYYDTKEKRLYLVQSKWIDKGKGEPENGEIKKFISGVVDLFNFRFSKFNEKINQMRDMIESAINDPYTKYSIVLTYPSIDGLAVHSTRDINEILDEFNDAGDIVDFILLKQQDLHSTLTNTFIGSPINVEISLLEYGKIEDPLVSYYGRISGNDLSKLWKNYHSRLFAKNIRSMLGDTEINNEMTNTLEQKPEYFWYFNNGITLICKSIKKTMAYAANNHVGNFLCEGISIVNGAQTVSTVGKINEIGAEQLDKVFIPIRIIEIGDNLNDIDRLITRANNRQNKIESRDFVTLDTEQFRIKRDLAIDGISYYIARSESFKSTDKSFDLVESTTALACASGKINLAVQLKREIGKLWEDIHKSPYKELFNPSITSIYVWQCVKFQRSIDRELYNIHEKVGYNEYMKSIIIHGNRVISYLTFNNINRNILENVDVDIDEYFNENNIDKLIEDIILKLIEVISNNFTNNIIPTLFKNASKCTEMIEIYKSGKKTSPQQELQFEK